MERWSRSDLGRNIRFLTVCVEGAQTAGMFNSMFQMSGVKNVILEGNPGFGQLGCSGFVLLDSEWRFVTRKSDAFLQYGDRAFASFEKLMRKTVAKDNAANDSGANASAGKVGPSGGGYTYSPGALAIVEGLKSAPHLNGEQVQVQEFDTSTGRFNVSLTKTGEIIAVRPCSLAPAERRAGAAATESQHGLVVGDLATIGGIAAASAQHLNGQRVVIDGFSKQGSGSGRVNVKLQTGELVSVKPGSLTKVDDEGGQNGGQRAQAEPVVEDNVSVRDIVIEVPESTGVQAMDDEHESCTMAMEAMLKARTRSTLVVVYEEFKEHFTHEEDLMHDYDFGTGGGEFSAANSHAKDHARILKVLSDEIERTKAVANAKISASFVKRVVDEFGTHADRFDSLYGDAIPCDA